MQNKQGSFGKLLQKLSPKPLLPQGGAAPMPPGAAPVFAPAEYTTAAGADGTPQAPAAYLGQGSPQGSRRSADPAKIPLCSACMSKPPNAGFPLCSGCFMMLKAGSLPRRCASCWAGVAQNRRDLCAACQKTWDASGGARCSYCRTAAPNFGHDLCSQCFTRWRNWVRPPHVSPDAPIASVFAQAVQSAPPAAPTVIQLKHHPSPNRVEVAYDVGVEQAIYADAPMKRSSSDSDGVGQQAHWTATEWAAEVRAGADEHDKCPVCLEEFADAEAGTSIVRLVSCSHFMHAECAEAALRSVPGEGAHFKCPICGALHGTVTGTQPGGTMILRLDRSLHLPGYDAFATIIVNYTMPSGVQEAVHPHPGAAYHGTKRIAYLPDCPDGRRVARMLIAAFKRKLVFTVGQSATTGADDRVVWAGLHHKTEISGGTANHGYPDPTYLSRVTQELAAVGVSE